MTGDRASIPPTERLRSLFAMGQIDINKHVPIRRYYRSCQEILRMAGVYYEEKNYENSYVLYAKFIILSLEKLKTHPAYSKVPPSEKAANKKGLKIAFEVAEHLKKLLKQKYEQEHKKYLQDKERQLLLAQEEEEKRRKEEERLMQEKEEELRMLEAQQIDAFIKQQKRKELEEERLAIEAQFAKTSINDSGPLLPVDFAPPPVLPEPQQLKVEPYTPAPAPVPTFDRNLKPVTLGGQVPNETAKTSSGSKTQNDVSSTAFAASLTQTKNKYGLRTILCPSNLPLDFMKYAKANTARNVETCGVLFGKLANEVFVITHVLLPHQKGAPDSCDTTREEDMWDFQDEYDGICLGWIHTHPSQTAFLSSVDLHTHYPYQCLMSESVAIVCSGKFNEIGYFMLTPHHGMNVIGKCSKPGFHPHNTNPALFETCDHVQTTTSQTAQIIDWRNK
uniref:STAM-binding protein-like n=1 Tax=Phallusia mammillata TaxID=59560 RepID=A0A6F9DT72_9ASCI|nr:STAM-binding protein-like [Phallusia mammillata]